MEAFEVVGSLVYDAAGDLLLPHETGLMEGTALMERDANGLRVELLWGPDANLGSRVFISVSDHGAMPLQAVVPADKALDAFWHPYCYLPSC